MELQIEKLFIQLKVEKRDYPYPASNHIFKVNNRNTTTRCEICSKLTIKAPTPLVSFCYLIVNVEHVLPLVLVFLLLTLRR